MGRKDSLVIFCNVDVHNLSFLQDKDKKEKKNTCSVCSISIKVLEPIFSKHKHAASWNHYDLHVLVTQTSSRFWFRNCLNDPGSRRSRISSKSIRRAAICSDGAHNVRILPPRCQSQAEAFDWKLWTSHSLSAMLTLSLHYKSKGPCLAEGRNF